MLSSLDRARNRIAELKKETNLREISTIWETYCDIEQSIEVSKYVFKLHDRLGTYRRLVASVKNDPTKMSARGLISIYNDVDFLVLSATRAVMERRGEEAIELSRKARDQLKLLLLGVARSEQSTMRRKKGTGNSSSQPRGNS